MRFSYLGFSGFGHRALYNVSAFLGIAAGRLPDPEPKIKRCAACAPCGYRPRAPRKGQWFVGAKRALAFFREATSEPLPRELAALRFHQRRFYLRAHNGVFKGVPPLTRFCSLLACTKSESSCGAETPPRDAPGGNAEESAY